MNVHANKTEVNAFLDKFNEMKRDVKQLLMDCLIEIGHPIEFDFDECDAPSISSGRFDDDLTDAYITKIWCNNGLVYVNLHAYYLGEDREGVDLSDEYDVDYADILLYILEELPE